MSAAARCRRHAIQSTGDRAGVSGGSASGRSATASHCTCSEDSPSIQADGTGLRKVVAEIQM